MSKNQKIKISRAHLLDILETEPELSKKEVEEILSRVDSSSDELPHWLVVTLKVIAYAIGIILAGYGSAAAASTLFIH